MGETGINLLIKEKLKDKVLWFACAERSINDTQIFVNYSNMLIILNTYIN
jgi:hypothetical protein